MGGEEGEGLKGLACRPKMASLSLTFFSYTVEWERGRVKSEGGGVKGF